jgi:hypothetical protein
MKIDNLFYIGEHGFYFNLKTGVDMTDALEVRAAWLKPDGMTLSPAPEVPAGDIINAATGEVNVVVPQGLLSAAGSYILQIVTRVAGGVIASRHIEFAVRKGAADNLAGIFGN